LKEENSEDNTVLEVILLTSVVLQKNLLILDGDPHGEYHKIEEDETRDNYLGSLGFTVLRYKPNCIPGTRIFSE
jgi:very-short-patch-repair endonuclease